MHTFDAVVSPFYNADHIKSISSELADQVSLNRHHCLSAHKKFTKEAYFSFIFLPLKGYIADLQRDLDV
ncbi:hypothetical protein APQ14_06310 [Vibrio toranzoniae]|uniref:Uncharacterized protein n=1 Tax=Vibrio toranzoniae TaxID=1194427 RepID=A0A120DGR8_9VIBR|nr:hypothetical protein APQ14_06310 [Vibrio toranzoniae]